jgi:tRNA A37 methylthiotransferase MiaB
VSANVYDSEVIYGQLQASGKDVCTKSEAEEGNIIVINHLRIYR